MGVHWLYLTTIKHFIIKVLSHYLIKLWFFTWSDQGKAESIPWRSKICRPYASLFCSLQIYQHKKALSEKLIQKAATYEGSFLDYASTSQTSSFPYHMTLLPNIFEIFTDMDQGNSQHLLGQQKYCWKLIQTLDEHHYRSAPQHRDVWPAQLVSHPKTFNLEQLVNKQLFKCHARRD